MTKRHLSKKVNGIFLMLSKELMNEFQKEVLILETTKTYQIFDCVTIKILNEIRLVDWNFHQSSLRS